MARTVNCIKLGKEAEGLDFPPYPPQTELGKKIWNQVSKEAWAAWLKQQTMLVNENRLNLADQRARQYLARQMETTFLERVPTWCKATRRRRLKRVGRLGRPRLRPRRRRR
jgi:Fe-S cluster biosynthesis and repair protein YggX